MVVNQRWQIQQEQIDNALSEGSLSDECESDVESVRDDGVLVPNGLGAPRGLNQEEHVSWAAQIEHPGRYEIDADLDVDLRAALEFECSNVPEAIDNFRSAEMDKLEKIAAELEDRRDAWSRDHGLVGHPLANRIHGPLFEALVEMTGYDRFDADLAADVAGFNWLAYFLRPDRTSRRKQRVRGILSQWMS